MRPDSAIPNYGSDRDRHLQAISGARFASTYAQTAQNADAKTEFPVNECAIFVDYDRICALHSWHHLLTSSLMTFAGERRFLMATNPVYIDVECYWHPEINGAAHAYS